MTGKSSCSSVASRRANKSKVWSTTQSGRAPVRSTLLTTTIGFKPWASALRVTKVVCGIGPSTASTSKTTESTIESTRSTSPPKSACPGVSTMFIRQSVASGAFQRIAVFFARMVIPRSFSISPLSIRRSACSPRSSTVPDWRSS